MRRRVLPVLIGIAVIATLGSLAYGWLAQLPTGPTISFSEFLRHVEAGEVATVVDREGTFTVVSRDGTTYEVVAPPPPGVNVTWLSMIKDAATSGGQTFEPANYREEPPLDLSWVGAVVVASVMTVLVAGYIYFMTGPDPLRPVT